MLLNRPIAFFDLESTGTNIANDQIVQIAVIKLFPDGNIEEKKLLIKPTIQIPKEATEVHGITNEDVENCQPFSRYSKSLSEFLSDCDFGGYNSDRFDIPLLMAEFDRCKIEFPVGDFFTVDVYGIEKKINSHKLGDTYKRYFGEDLDGSHDAMVDTRAAMYILQEQITKHFKDDISIEELQKQGSGDKVRVDVGGYITKEEENYILTFGKHKGKVINGTDKDLLQYIDWMLRADSTFPSQTKRILREIVELEIEKLKGNE